MNRTKIKNYAPQARRDFIRAVTDRAAFYGLTAERIEPVTVQGDVALIAGRAFPKEVGERRKRLQERVERDGFGPTMEALAYTWFNRLVAIRYMELHGYLDHGYRVLSHPDPARTMPEILEHAEHVELPGLNRDRVIELKLDGTREAELYRMLLVAQCNALHSAMPFLFERIGDETELVLPEGLLHSDSIVRKLVSGIDEEDWQEVEIIGWLYQFYISEKKDEVIGKVVASEDIPAATQLFTPNWIVKYLVQNTLGRLWLATYPQSPLKGQMKYYIEPAEQTPEVQEQLRAITPTSLNPEEITFLDPACGSAHILVEAYDLFKAIYQERGYRAKDIPRLILTKNLFGLEIDDRAAQLAAFALMMKARADDRRILESEAKPNILAFQESKGMDAADVVHALNSPIHAESVTPSTFLFEEIEQAKTPLFGLKSVSENGLLSHGDITTLLDLFENAKTFGSLIQVPTILAAKLTKIGNRIDDVLMNGNLTQVSARVLKPLIQQAQFLTRRYDVVVTNPPYMGSMYLNPRIKAFLRADFIGFDKDLFSASIRRYHTLVKTDGFEGYITPFNWMFITSFTSMREWLIANKVLRSLVQLEVNAFEPAMVTVCSFILQNTQNMAFKGSFVKLSDFRGVDSQPEKTLEAIHDRNSAWYYEAKAIHFSLIPSSPIAYWVSESVREAFQNDKLREHFISEGAVKTGNNQKFIRYAWEISNNKISASGPWRKHPKGGDFRKWYGNVDSVVKWDAFSIHHYRTDHIARILPQEYWEIEGISWSAITTGRASFRLLSRDEVANNAALCIFPVREDELYSALAFLNSKVAESLIDVVSQTLNTLVGDILSLPFVLAPSTKPQLDSNAKECVNIAIEDWNSLETSPGFLILPWLNWTGGIETQMTDWAVSKSSASTRLKALEEENNRLFIEAYGLQMELSSEVPDDQITLYRPDREEDIKRLISHAVGCTMGRYSLDTPGLVYAHGGNVGFDPDQYHTFPADPDGIVPVMEADWFADDAANRFIEFLGVVWPSEGLDENLKFVADALGPSRNEQPRDTIRRYLATGFFKHHLQTYKRRPIYWLFSSGKQRAFQCLVYLHRYQEGTLSRMRTEYVIPLQGKLAARIDQLKDDIAKATSTSHRNTLTRERDKLIKQQAELQAYDEKLRHQADMRITLDLDDGVKVNYGKFGDLLAEVRAVTGGGGEE